MKHIFIFVSFLKILRVAVGLTYSAQNWNPVTVSQSKENLLFTHIETPATLTTAANSCLKSQDCKLLCQTNDTFVMSSLEIDPEYHEFNRTSTYQCWTTLPSEFWLEFDNKNIISSIEIQ